MYAKTPSIEFGLQYSLQKKRSGSEVMFFAKNVQRPFKEDDFLNILTK